MLLAVTEHFTGESESHLAWPPFQTVFDITAVKFAVKAKHVDKTT